MFRFSSQIAYGWGIKNCWKQLIFNKIRCQLKQSALFGCFSFATTYTWYTCVENIERLTHFWFITNFWFIIATYYFSFPSKESVLTFQTQHCMVPYHNRKRYSLCFLCLFLFLIPCVFPVRNYFSPFSLFSLWSENPLLALQKLNYQ